jgi:hypothetical protein
VEENSQCVESIPIITIVKRLRCIHEFVVRGLMMDGGQIASCSPRRHVVYSFVNISFSPGKQDLVGDLTFIMCVCRARIV